MVWLIALLSFAVENPNPTEAPPAPAPVELRSTYVDIQGIYDFRHFERIKRKVMIQLPRGSLFIEKRMRRGRVMVLLRSPLPTPAILQRLNSVDLEPGRFRLIEEDDNLLRVTVR